jgi:lysophospholipase L1-like esterase
LPSNNIKIEDKSSKDNIYWNLDKFPAELRVRCKIKNRGIMGDDSFGILNRISPVAESKPKKIFLMIGINDLSEHIKTDSVAQNYANIIKRIRSISSHTKIYI